MIKLPVSNLAGVEFEEIHIEYGDDITKYVKAIENYLYKTIPSPIYQRFRELFFEYLLKNNITNTKKLMFPPQHFHDFLEGK